MCLTLPGRVVRVDGAGTPEASAVVEFEGSRRSASLLMLPDVGPGEYILVQAGIAIARVPAEEAERTLALARRPLAAGGSDAAAPGAPHPPGDGR